MRPDQGQVVLGGLEVSALGQRALPAVRRERIGFIFQSFNLLSALTARENVKLALHLAGRRDRARAMVTDPNIILADEPTANLDSRSGRQVMSLLAEAARERGKAVVIVSHDARLQEVADRVLWMEDGRLEPGTPIAATP